MDKSAVWNVLKWVLAALAAGFIGQFGRSLALRIIERKRDRKFKRDGKSTEASSTIPEQKDRDLKTLQKIEKKRAKRKLKETKKRSG